MERQSNPTTTTAFIYGNTNNAISPDKAREIIQTIMHGAIDEMFNKNSSLLSFEELYRTAYMLVRAKHGQLLYDHCMAQVESHLEREALHITNSSSYAGSELNPNLFLDDVIETYLSCSKILRMIQNVLMYLDRTFVVRQYNTTLHLQFLEVLYRVLLPAETVRAKLTEALLTMVARTRLGEFVENEEVIRRCCTMLIELSALSPNGPMNSNGHVYETIFESHFLSRSEIYFKRVSAEKIDTYTVPVYVSWASETQECERKRAQKYFPVQTGPRLANLVERELCRVHADTLISSPQTGLRAMVIASRHDEISHLYKLLAFSAAAVSHIADAMQQCLLESANLVLGEDPTHNDVSMVSKLIQLKLRFDDLVYRALGPDKVFAKAMKSGWENIMNAGTGTTAAEESLMLSSTHNGEITWIAKLLALHLDEGLKSGFKNTQVGADTEIDHAVALFRHLYNKDVFESYYKTFLAKRLLNGRSNSDDLELAAIAKLKLECGSQFTSKLEGMFKDNKNANKEHEFRIPEEEADGGGGAQTTIGFRPIVLSSGYWPERDVGLVPIDADKSVRLPAMLRSSLMAFEKEYLQVHQGRCISWILHSYGTCDIKASGFVGDVKSYDLTVSIYQACVLMLFQAREVRQLTFKEILEGTLIPAEELRRHLISMAIKPPPNMPSFQVLIKSGDKKTFLDDDMYTFNHEFKSKFRKVRIPLVSVNANFRKDGEGSSGKTEDGGDVVPAAVQEERKNGMDAAIVRVMKSRKTLDHAALVSEVIRQLRFKPQVVDVKKRIESLIDREYLARDENDARMYVYLA